MANTDCGDCDWPTCNEYSVAIIDGKDANPHKCAPGGAESWANAEAILYAYKNQKLPETVLGGKPLKAGGEPEPAAAVAAPAPAVAEKAPEGEAEPTEE